MYGRIEKIVKICVNVPIQAFLFRSKLDLQNWNTMSICCTSVVCCMLSNFNRFIIIYIVKVSNARFTFVFRLVAFVTIELSLISVHFKLLNFVTFNTRRTNRTQAKFPHFIQPTFDSEQIKMRNKMCIPRFLVLVYYVGTVNCVLRCWQRI